MAQSLSQDAQMTAPLAPLHYHKGHVSVEGALPHMRGVKGMLALDRLAPRILWRDSLPHHAVLQALT